MPDAPDAIVCPSCGRKLSARARTCFYCRKDLTTPSTPPPGGKTVCPLCATEYDAKAAGCPNCRTQTEKLVDMADRQRAESSSKRAFVIGGVLLLVFGGVGAVVQDAIDEGAPAFGIGGSEYAACAALALVVSIGVAFVVFRIIPTGDARSTLAKVLYPIIVGAIGTPLWFPWTLAGVLWANARGLEPPFPKVTCTIVAGRTVRNSLWADIECKPNGQEVRGSLPVQSFDIAVVGGPVELPLVKGHMGIWVRGHDNPLWK
jgi:hypothetical protein